MGGGVCDFLLARGRPPPAIISGRDGRAARRARAFQATAKKLGIEVPIEWIPAPGTLLGGREATGRLLESPARPDAIFCSSALVALGVVTEADARGVTVPLELAVVGFGNLNFAEGMIPPLTTVHVDGPRIGRLAGTLLVDRAEGREPSGPSVDVRFSILERAST
jgi:LacI family gluconate utilization system Gnt-I transcriptional repressor